jgi:NTE family protein
MISRWLVSGLGIVSTVISFQLFAYTAVKVDESQQTEQVSKRPTVAVVLAGGGAKGQRLYEKQQAENPEVAFSRPN